MSERASGRREFHTELGMCVEVHVQVLTLLEFHSCLVRLHCSQVFGFLLGIDLQGMSRGPSGEGEDGDDQMADVPSPPPAAEARAAPQAEAKQPEENEEDVRGFST